MDIGNDAILLKKLKAGDKKAFRKIYLKYNKKLFSVGIKYLRSKELAEDAIHDIFLKLWNNRKKLDNSGSLKGFLFTAVKNHVLNMISSNKRKMKKHIKLSYEKKVNRVEQDNVISISKYRERYELAVEQLPEKRREIFKLRTNDGLTNKEVAQYLNLSVHTVKSQYYKASNFIKSYVIKSMNRETGT